MKAYHIYLLRHGITEGNKKRQYIGVTDMPLCEEGRQQLKELASAKEYPAVQAFYSSPLKRCTESLGIIYPEAQIQLAHKLRECDLGDYEGKTYEELKENEVYRQWIAGEGKAAPPNGESGIEFQTRCCEGFSEIVENVMRGGIQNTVIMTHGGTIMSILSSFGYPRKPFFDWLTENGKGYEVITSPQLWMSGKVVEIAGAIPDDKSKK